MAKKRIFFITVIFILFIWILFIYHFNSKYSEKEKSYVGMNEYIEAPYGECKISEAKMYDLPAFIAEYPEISWNGGSYGEWFLEYVDGNDIRILVYKADVKFNDSDSMDMAQQYPKTIVTRDKMYYSGYNLDLTTLLNEDVYITADGNLSAQAVFLFDRESMTEEEWNKMSESDCNIDVVVQSNPIEKKIMLSDTEYIVATEEEKDYVKELAVEEKEIEEAAEEYSRDLTDQNVFPDGTGEYRKMSITVDSIKEVDPLEANEIYDSDNWLFEIGGAACEVPGDYKKVEKAFEVDVTVTNLSDSVNRYPMFGATLWTVDGEDFVAGATICYLSPMDCDGRNADVIVLQPNETRELVLLYYYVSVFEADENGGYAGLERAESWYNYDVYLELGYAGSHHTKMIASDVYIKCNWEK